MKGLLQAPDVGYVHIFPGHFKPSDCARAHAHSSRRACPLAESPRARARARAHSLCVCEAGVQRRTPRTCIIIEIEPRERKILLSSQTS